MEKFNGNENDLLDHLRDLLATSHRSRARRDILTSAYGQPHTPRVTRPVHTPYRNSQSSERELNSAVNEYTTRADSRPRSRQGPDHQHQRRTHILDSQNYMYYSYCFFFVCFCFYFFVGPGRPRTLSPPGHSVIFIIFVQW
jgi:hypothetical protein